MRFMAINTVLCLDNVSILLLVMFISYSTVTLNIIMEEC